MWKFQDLSVIQILREINFGESKSSKIAVSCNFRGSESAYLRYGFIKKLEKLVSLNVKEMLQKI